MSSISNAVSAHADLTGLTTGDDHTQYLLLAGRSGGQVARGGLIAGETLDLRSNANALPGAVVLSDATLTFSVTPAGAGAQAEAMRVMRLGSTTFDVGLAIGTTTPVAQDRGALYVAGITSLQQTADNFSLLQVRDSAQVHHWSVYLQSSTTDGLRFFDVVNGRDRLSLEKTELVVNDPGVDYDFRVESDNLTHLLFTDASADRVGVGTSTPAALLAVGSTSQFRVATDGDLERIKDVLYDWPAANAAGYLRNNGSGTLSWDATGAGIDHGGLGGLADDTHAQYLLLAGRSGGQSAFGGTASGNHLTLAANSVAFAPASAGRIRANTAIDFINAGYTQAGGTTTWSLINFSSTVTISSGLIPDILSGFTFAPTITGYDTATTGLNLVSTFRSAQLIRPGANLTDQGFFVGFDANPQYSPLTGVTATADILWGFMGRPYTSRAGTGVGNTTSVAAFRSWPAVFLTVDFSSAGTHASVVHLLCGNPLKGASDTITEQVGVDIPSWTNGTTKLTLRSVGTTAEMRHAGQGKFGATGAPDTTNGNVFELERVLTITGAVGDGQAAGLVLDPGYTAATALTVTRHNYIKCEDVSVAGAGPAAVTDSAILWLDAATGTHKATHAGNADALTLLNGPTGKAGNPNGYLKINVNGTIRYMPYW